MTNLLENMGIIITTIIRWLGQIASALIQNPIFDMLIAIILFLLLVSLIIKIINNRTGFIDRIYWNRRNKN